MKRLHLFEFHDLDSFPHAWRNLTTDWLAFFEQVFNPYQRAFPMLVQAARTAGASNLLDLCSGSGQAMISLAGFLEKIGDQSLVITLTDKFPDLQAFEAAAKNSRGRIRFLPEPVDAAALPAGLNGFRTMFTSFHHFRPEAALGLIKDAVAQNQGIGIFEYTEWSWVWFCALLFSPLVFAAAAFLIKPFSWKRLFWTLTILPMLCAIWDGYVSCLRTYSTAQLNELVRKAGAGHYVWRTERIRSFGGCFLTCLIGFPAPDAPKTADAEF